MKLLNGRKLYSLLIGITNFKTMSKLTLILGGALAYLLLKGRRIVKDDVINQIQPQINLEYFITPFQPGVVQYGTLTINNDSNQSIEIESLSITTADYQYAQDLKERVYIGATDKSILSATLKYGNTYYRPNEVVTDPNVLRLPAHGSLTFDISIQSIMDKPLGAPLVVSTDFENYPFTAWFNLDIKTKQGEYMATIAANYSSFKK